jgi:hypothetical protein
LEEGVEIGCAGFGFDVVGLDVVDVVEMEDGELFGLHASTMEVI